MESQYVVTYEIKNTRLIPRIVEYDPDIYKGNWKLLTKKEAEEDLTEKLLALIR